MDAREHGRKPRADDRRWCLPPAVLRDPHESLQGLRILEEFPGEAGLILWNATRDVSLWATTPREDREGLFNPLTAPHRISEIARSVEIETPEQLSLTSLVAVVATPAAASEEVIALACTGLSEWASSRGAMSTAVEFAQAAAFARPESADAALRVGQLVVSWAQRATNDVQRQRLGRAETWLRRATGLGRRARAWEAYGRAYVELGHICRMRGMPVPAARHYALAARAARRAGHLPVRAAALHGLLLVSVDLRDFDAADRYARAATRAYGRRNPLLPSLLHDVAYLHVTSGCFERAIPILRRLLPTRNSPAGKALTCALLARAAAGTGDTEGYRAAWSDAWLLVTRPGASPTEGRNVLLELLRAATAAKDQPRVDQAMRLGGAEPGAAARKGGSR